MNPAERKRQETLLLLEKAKQEQNPIKFLLLENHLDAVALREMNLSAKILMKNFGFNAPLFRGLGFSAKEVLDAGIDPLNIAMARYPAKELKKADIELKDIIGIGKKRLLELKYTEEEISNWATKSQ